MSLDSHILDNPIWNALISGDKTHAWGNDLVRGIDREMGVFAGLKNYEAYAWQALYEMTMPGTVIVLFSPDRLIVPKEWTISLEKPLLQMVHQSDIQGMNSENIVDLQEEHIPAMIHLTHLTKPGPFLPRTIDFGHYQGIFEQGELVSMAGQRFKPDPYTEVSAVCTHPKALGKGYAKMLLQSQIRMIRSAGRIPFLHVYPENVSAVGLYQKLGFEVRRELIVYVIIRS